MTFTSRAWNFILPIFETIKSHPFNVELVEGRLSEDRFMYYIEQDALYLRDFARCHALLAARAPFEFMALFLRFANETCVAEQELVHQFFREKFSATFKNTKTTAAFSYNNYLIRTCCIDSVEAAMAALLPCFMVYQQLGVWMSRVEINEDHPYARWIEVYSSDVFLQSVEAMRSAVDQHAATVHPSTERLMMEAFYNSTCLEWHFWNDAYVLNRFDEFLSPSPKRTFPCPESREAISSN